MQSFIFEGRVSALGKDVVSGLWLGYSSIVQRFCKVGLQDYVSCCDHYHLLHILMLL